MAIIFSIDSLLIYRIEVVGKFPTGEEAVKFKKEEGVIDWFPTKEGLYWWNDFVTRHVL